VPSERSRYRPDAEPDYSHRFHAGNVGDVWKHCVLVEMLRHVAAGAPSTTYIETHAGEGRYALASTGEWSEGIGKLWDDARGTSGDAVARYVALSRRLGTGAARPEQYPGSPLFARAVLGANAQLVLWEHDAVAVAHLRATLGSDSSTDVHTGDGLTALAGEVAAAEQRGDDTDVVALIDPPWTQKPDWTRIPDALALAAQSAQRTRFMLWYPIKSLTRPNAMIARLAAAGVAGTIVELVTTPLEHQRQRLNGSGVLLVRPPAGALEAIAASAPAIGARCATRPDTWSCRVHSWSAKI
jgi:23S rRNA (adenine2030-N6)-methyltransferase